MEVYLGKIYTPIVFGDKFESLFKTHDPLGVSEYNFKTYLQKYNLNMQQITKENDMTNELQEKIWIQAQPGITIFTNINYVVQLKFLMF